MTVMLLVAKAPVPGEVKTRLAATVGDDRAARIAAACLLDTIAACTDVAGPARCRLALSGDLRAAVRGEEIRRALCGWTVVPQASGSLGERLAAAHRGVPGQVVQVGMDTPQVTPELLLAAAAPLAEHEAVLGPADDGGWWVLALRAGHLAEPLGSVPMSRATTHDDTRRALLARGLSVGTAPVLRDVDVIDDVDVVVAQAPDGRFAQTVRSLRGAA